MRSHSPPASALHLVAPASYGGLETVIVALTSGLQAAGLEVGVAPILTQAAEVERHPFMRALATQGVEVEPIVVGRRAYWSERARVREILNGRRPDILHTHGFRPDVVDAPVARSMGVATVTTVHGFTGGGWRARLYERMQLRSLRDFAGVVAVSAPLRERAVYAGVRPERAHLVPNAWHASGGGMSRREARRALGLSAEGARVGWVGRFTSEKGPNIMVQVASKLRHGGTRVSMIGTGPMEAECRTLAESLGVSDRVTWHGMVPDAGNYLRAFEALVLTSWTEGTPMVLLEAMAAGVPIVATSVGGVPDLLTAETAVLCDAGDVEQLARGVDEVLWSPTAARARADKAHQRLLERFNLEAWVQQYLAVYEDACRDSHK